MINFNADIGEGIGNEKELMPYLHSCNIASGGHACAQSCNNSNLKEAYK